MEVVPLGLDLAPFRLLRSPGNRDGSLTVGWLGRLVEVKDVPLLLRVMEEAFRTNPRIRFVIAGDGTQRHLMKEAAQRWGAERLNWLGWTRDVAGVIARCDVLIQTSRSEGTPIALIQGMAAARPFISTAAGGVVDMVSGPVVLEARGCRWYSNAVLAEPDPKAFADALSRFAEHPMLLERMGQEASHFACARHNLASVARNYDRLYSRLLADRLDLPGSIPMGNPAPAPLTGITEDL